MKRQFDKEFFDTNGYQIIENLFSKDQCDKLINEANGYVSDNYTPLMNKHFDLSEIFEFISNQKLVDIIEEYFGDTAMGLQTEFFFMPPNTRGFNAHQDNTFVKAKENTFLSAWIALTDVFKENGGLIIWPKSHNEKQIIFEETGEKKIVNQDPNANRTMTLLPDNYKSITPILKKGSVLLIDKWLVHASNTNNTDNFRYSLLCTYIKKGADFRKGNYANREVFKLSA